MLSIYIGVYKALFDYVGQTEDELSILSDDLLYLLEKSDVDDWWKVKKRVVAQGNQDVEEPIGLVPSNYIEQAPVLQKATALYDYDKQTEDELSFKEGAVFDVYDASDSDWNLVGLPSEGLFGFIPSNYVETTETATPVAANSLSQEHPSQQFKTTSMPPPLHPAQSQDFRQTSQSLYGTNEPKESAGMRRSNVNDSDEPPPMPTRPTSVPSSPNGHELVDDQLLKSENNEKDYSQEHNYDGEYFTWYIDEIDGRKKRAVILSIGKGLVILKPNHSGASKLRFKSSSLLDNEWRINDLVDYSLEKKHLFLEFKNPSASIELHAGSKDVTEAVISILADLKGADSAKGLREVVRASQTSTSPSNRKIGRVMYYFKAEGGDELEAYAGDEVYILDESKSKEWWMCEDIASKRQGVIPSSYIEIVGTTNLDKLTDKLIKRKSSKGVVVNGDKSGHRHRNRTRDERDRIREKDRLQRQKSINSQGSRSHESSKPNGHRVRTWIDSSGSYKVESEFLGYVNGKIQLHKTNGVKISVAPEKLSIEDLEYVERVAEVDLEDAKKAVAKQHAKKSRTSSGTNNSTSSATARINDLSSPTRAHESSNSRFRSESAADLEYDWFEFFLSCGVDLGNCQRYTANFNREQMDENILQDITPSLLRTLGLREGDILRVMKHLDAKFDRHKPIGDENSSGGLFSGPGGELKQNNSSAELSKVDARDLPSPQKSELPKLPTERMEDDVWAIKPAARSNEDLSRLSNSRSQTPQFTGSLQDLVDIKPVDSNNSHAQTIKTEQVPSAPTLTPGIIGNTKLNQPVQNNSVAQLLSQLTQNQIKKATGPNLVPVQRTGNFIPVNRTGGLLPSQPTGFITAQPTGFIPITAQPTGFIPIQTTGILNPQFTFGIVPNQPAQTGISAQRTPGGFEMPLATTFGNTIGSSFIPLQTGSVTMSQPTFGQPFSLQQTGPLIPMQRTGPIGQAVGQQPPATSFGNQSTGGTFPNSFVPESKFGRQITGGAFPQTSFGQQLTGGIPQTSFGQQLTGGFAQNSSIQQPTGGFPQTSFSQQPTGGFNLQQTFNGVPQQQNTVFSQFGQQQPSYQPNIPNIGQVTNLMQNTSLGYQPTQVQPMTSFGQTPMENNFGPSLQSQPTGLGFGNAPNLQHQHTGRRANLQAATPNNPFGFQS